MNQKKFYRCPKCGNIVSYYANKGVPVMCCGQAMVEMQPNTTEAAGEKHLPVVHAENGVVEVLVGEVAHPMTEEHLIAWVYLETDKGGYEKFLTAADAPKAVFHIGEEKPLRAYEYCNLHGLWSVEL